MEPTQGEERCPFTLGRPPCGWAGGYHPHPPGVAWAQWPRPPFVASRVGVDSRVGGQGSVLASLPTPAAIPQVHKHAQVPSFMERNLPPNVLRPRISLQPPPSSLLGRYKSYLVAASCPPPVSSPLPSVFLPCPCSGVALPKITQDLSDLQGPPSAPALVFIQPSLSRPPPPTLPCLIS